MGADAIITAVDGAHRDGDQLFRLRVQALAGGFGDRQHIAQKSAVAAHRLIYFGNKAEFLFDLFLNFNRFLVPVFLVEFYGSHNITSKVV